MPEIWGTTYVETARDKLVTKLEALKTQMSGYSPTFNYVYETHNAAYMKLNAVTVGFDFETIEGNISGNTFQHSLVFSIRVHTAYGDGWQDEQKQSRLLNSIVNKLLANNNLSDGHRILQAPQNVTTGNKFEESDSLGGSLQVTVYVAVEHTQE